MGGALRRVAVVAVAAAGGFGAALLGSAGPPAAAQGGFQLLYERPIEPAAPGASEGPEVTLPLIGGRKYRLEASGTIQYVFDPNSPNDFNDDDALKVDPVFCYFSSKANSGCNQATQPTESDDLFVQAPGSTPSYGSMGDINGQEQSFSYNASTHTYAREFTALVDGPLRLRHIARNGRATGAISGSFTVKVYEDRGNAAPPTTTGGTTTTPVACGGGTRAAAPPVGARAACVQAQGPRTARTWGRGSVAVPLNPGKGASVASPTLGKRQGQATVSVRDPGGEAVSVLVDAKFRNYARLQCVLSMAAFQQRSLDFTKLKLDDLTAQSTIGDQQRLAYAGMLQACLSLVDELLARQQAGDTRRHVRAHASANSCRPLRTRLAFVRSGSGAPYKATIPKTAPAANLTVTCRRSVGNVMKVTVKPKRRGVALRTIVGSRLVLGIVQPRTAGGGSTVRVGFAR
jgi:hypothetical protein